MKVRPTSLALSTILFTFIACKPQQQASSHQLPSAVTDPSGPSTKLDEIKPPKGDAIEEGLWWLYHLKYSESRDAFDRYIALRPQSPLGYFYKTGVGWWQLAQDLEMSQPEVEKQFTKDYEDTVRIAQALYKDSKDQKQKALALLCEGGALGLRGRWMVTQNEWGQAYSLGKKGYKLLKQSTELDPNRNEAYLGLGIYDYYTATLPGISGFFAKMVMHGDKKRGLLELQKTVDSCPNARVEAMMFLIQIYTTFEKTPAKGLALAQQLRKEFPASPLMHLTEINCLLENKKWSLVKREAKAFVYRCHKGTPLYSREHVKGGLYFVGLGTLFADQDPRLCIKYMNQVLSTEGGGSQWLSFATLKRGQAYDVLGEREKAISDYRDVLKRKNVWNSHKMANRYLKKPFSLENTSDNT